MEQTGVKFCEGCGKNKSECHKPYCDFHISFCGECGVKLPDVAFSSHYESRGEFWGAPCSENVLDGYQCVECGFEFEN